MIRRVKICIVSDSHDRADALERAVCDAAAEGAQAVVHCGDLIGAHTLRPALRAGIPMHVIHGNNLGDPLALHNLSRASGGLLHYHGPDARLELGGRKIFLVHYPEYGYAMACTGNWDLVRSEEHTSELQSLAYLVCRLLLEKKKNEKSAS